MKKLIIALTMITSSIVLAAPNPPRPHIPHPIHHKVHQSHNHGIWGRGGRNFWPGFVSGIAVSHIVSVAQRNVIWIEGKYVDVVQPNGTIVRVWQPGHYE